MQVGDALRALDNPLVLEAMTPARARSLRARLDACGYEEAAVCHRLGVPDVGDIQAAHMPMYLSVRLGSTPLDTAVRLFLLGVAEPSAAVAELLGDDGLAALTECGVLTPDGGAVRCPFSLFPILGRLVLTDKLITKRYHRRYVMPLGGDSYTLARAIVPSQGRVLDLCTGSGVQAIVAAREAASVVAVDVNPRALHFVAFNARLNEVANLETRLGSIYEPVGEAERFERILANPPFVPTPDKTLPLYRGGGESGEDVLQPLIEGLARHLEPGGIAQIYSVMVSDRERSFTGKVNDWLAGMPHGVLIRLYSRRSPEEFAMNHLVEMEEAWELEGFRQRLEQWVSSFRRQGFTDVTEGVIHVQRLPAGHESWAYERLLQRLSRRYADVIQAFFANAARLQDAHALAAWRPAWADGVRACWQGSDGGGRALYAVTCADSELPAFRDIDEAQFQALRLCDGARTVAEMEAGWAGARPFGQVLTELVALELLA